MNSAIWQPLMERIASRRQVIAVDLPGHGLSPPLRQAELSDWADAVAPLLDQYDQPVELLGWSLGGLVAIRLSQRYRPRIASLTLITSNPRFVAARDWPCAVEPRQFDEFAAALHQESSATLRRFLALQTLGLPGAKAKARQLADALAQRGSADQEALAQGLALLLGEDLRDELAALAASGLPIHALLGERDTLVPATLADPLRALIGERAVELLPGAAHGIPFTHSEAIERALLS